MTPSQQYAARIDRSHTTTDIARNEKQKAFLLEHVATRLSKTTVALCDESRRLVAESKARCAQARKLIEDANA